MKLLLAEDTRDLNRAVTVLLERSGYQVDSALDGQEALNFLERDSYDAAILDIMMPRVDGLEVLRQMRARRLPTPVLLLTAKSEVDDRVLGLDAGADDYLTKPFAMKELLARVRALTRRGATLREGTLTFSNLTLNSETFALSAHNAVRLSVKEFEMMQALVLSAGHTLSTAYFLEHVWKNEPEANEDTVWLYIRYLTGKLFSVGAAATIEGERAGAFRLVEDKA